VSTSVRFDDVFEHPTRNTVDRTTTLHNNKFIYCPLVVFYSPDQNHTVDNHTLGVRWHQEPQRLKNVQRFAHSWVIHIKIKCLKPERSELIQEIAIHDQVVGLVQRS